jgi:decaprenyl-phosphate phosphoribosyltransferase
MKARAPRASWPGASHAGPERETLPRGLLRQARPRQWAKNVLVLAAPTAAGVLDSVNAAVQVLVAVVAFCLASSGTYYLNDLLDVEADRRHPVKRFRPIAAGVVPVPLARVMAGLLMTGGVTVALLAGGWELPVVVLAYVVLSTGYSTYLKHIAVVDIVAVAAGFVLRALGGAAAVDVPVSRWFFIVASLGSLFMVACKRNAELRALAGEAAGVRSTHATYTSGYLSYVESTASGAALVAYCLWAFERQGEMSGSIPFFVLSIAPFALGLLRYALLVDQGAGEEPEEVVLRDRPLLACAAAVAGLLTLGLVFS